VVVHLRLSLRVRCGRAPARLPWSCICVVVVIVHLRVAVMMNLPRLVGVLSSKQTQVSGWREVRLEEFKVGWDFAGSSSIDAAPRIQPDLR